MGKGRRARRGSWLPVAVAAVLVAVFIFGRMARSVRRRAAQRPPADASLVLVTGYCNCGKCCGWRRSLMGFGEPVYDYGPMKGKPKKIGITASGKRAKKGTIAADPKRYKFGTHLHVPGYGVGTVEDVGGSIKGRHIDIWFPTHEAARRWGARWLKVREIR